MPQKGEYGYLNARMKKQAGLSIFGLAIITYIIVQSDLNKIAQQQ